jgi:small-conductance mechanosensitive channel
MNSTNTLSTITPITLENIVSSVPKSEAVASPIFGLESLVPKEYLSYLGLLSNTNIFNNSLLSYLFALLVVVLAYVVLPLVWGRLTTYLVFVVNSAAPGSASLLKEQFGKFNRKVFLIIAVYIGAMTLNLPGIVMVTLKGVVFALIGVQVAIILGPLVEPLVRSIPVLNKPDMRPITSRVVVALKTGLWALVGIFSLGSLGVNTGPLLGGLGVLGLGGALAFQQMVPGFIKILSFHFSKNFSIGDKISAGVHQGVVEEIDISTTRIKKANGDQVDVKNEELMTAIVIPTDGPHLISESIKIILATENDAKIFSEVEDIFKVALGKIADTKFEKMAFIDFKGSGVCVDLNYSVVLDKKIEARHALLSYLLSEFKSKNISFTGV